MSPFLLLLIGFGASATAFLVLWMLWLKGAKAAWVDVLWAGATGGLAVAFALAAMMSGGNHLRCALVGAMGGLWSLRLTAHLISRVRRLPPGGEDTRYARMKNAAGAKAPSVFLAFYLAQALWALLFSAPMLGAALRDGPLAWTDALGPAIWLVAVGGEALADAQLRRFAANPANKGQVCREGLWAHSRHPNYFFEWLHWWAYLAIGIAGLPWGWLTLSGPFFMLFLLFTATGVLPAELSSLRGRGAAYVRYRREVSPWLPWFKRS